MYDIRIIYMVFRKEDSMNLLSKVNSPQDIKGMSIEELKQLANLRSTDSSRKRNGWSYGAEPWFCRSNLGASLRV